MRGIVLISIWLIAFTFISNASLAYAEDRTFVTSDHVRLHYTDTGHGHTLVFLPGWTMPGWIFQMQADEFSASNRVVMLDPRGQGQSEIAKDGYDTTRRATDIKELLDQLGPDPVLLVGWSVSVLECLSYLRRFGDERVAGLVLIDNSVGEDPPPAPAKHRTGVAPKTAETARRSTIISMFDHPLREPVLARLTKASLRMPQDAAISLLSGTESRGYWRDAFYSTDKPILYAVTPRFAAQADTVAENASNAETIVFSDAGHALFADAPERFNFILDSFLLKVWPEKTQAARK